MSLIEESIVGVPENKEIKKKRKSESQGDNIPNVDAESPVEEGTRLNVRKKKKKFHNAGNEKQNESPKTVCTDSDVNRNVESVPIRMRERNVHMKGLQSMVTECVEQISKTKKVSFNDKINSQLFSSRKRNKLKLSTIETMEQPPPKSILKHRQLEYVVTKNRVKKRKDQTHQKKNESGTILVPGRKKQTNKQIKALLYLERWKNDNSSWKFEKLSQTWLLKNMFDCSTVPEDTFLILLDYLSKMTGSAVTLATKQSESIIRVAEENLVVSQKDECLEKVYHRARSVLQHLR